MADEKYPIPAPPASESRKRKSPPPRPVVSDDDDGKGKEEDEKNEEPAAKRPHAEQQERWSELPPSDISRRAVSLSVNCHKLEAKAAAGRLDAREIDAFASSIPMFYDWLSGNFIMACRIKMNTRSADDERKGAQAEDVIDVSDEERYEGAHFRLSMMEMIMITIMQCLRMVPAERERMQSACVKFEEECLKIRREPRISTTEKLEAVLHRVRREIFTFHHAWKVNIDYGLVAKAHMRSHAELYEYEMTERELADFYRRNPQYLTERKLREEQPKPRLYRDQILESERKANPVLDLAWSLSREELIWLCASWLCDTGVSKLTRTSCDFVHACAWFLFHANFCAQLWSMHDTVPLTTTVEARLNAMRIRLISTVVESLSLDRDAETRDSSEGITYRLSSPVGVNEYFIGNNEFDVDRHHTKLQKICNWLEPTKLLQEAWLASMRAVGEVTPVDALLEHASRRVQSVASSSASSPEFQDLLVPEVHFYQSFATMVRFMCDITLDNYVVFGADVMERYSSLSDLYDSELPLLHKRPQIIAFARKFAVRVGKKYHMCTYLWQACMLWLSMMTDDFYGRTSDGKSVNKLARKLGLETKTPPRPQFLQRVYGQALPLEPGGSSENIEDQGGRPPPSSPPPPPPHVASAAAAAAAAPSSPPPPPPRPVAGDSLDDVD
jgi:hypothetical protein